jgi:hypothetical protein
MARMRCPGAAPGVPEGHSGAGKLTTTGSLMKGVK